MYPRHVETQAVYMYNIISSIGRTERCIDGDAARTGLPGSDSEGWA